MVSGKFVIKNENGLHLRPAGMLCEEALQYQASIKLKVGENVTVDAKSVLGVLAAGVKCGMEIELVCDGPDEEDALYGLGGLIEGGFEKHRG